MIKTVFLLSVTISISFASNLSTLYKLYEKQNYEKACAYAEKYFYKKSNKRSEKYLTLYGLACLETDAIDKIAIPMVQLKKKEDSRANASYFATILLQKQLLLQALLDQKSLGDLFLPKTNFILSKVFALYIEHKYTHKNNIYTLEDKNKKDIFYKLYIKKKRNMMILDVYKDDKFTKRYQYK